ncbi:DNA repair protein RecO [Neomicrococcus lactis]|nr:DNA repair protein RecO [Neomicrococcus lactis]
MSRNASFAARSYRTHGIVLRTYKLGEADRIIVMLSPEYGQIRAVAKGVRRTSSKLGATLEPFMLVDAQIVHGRTLDIITQAQLQRPYGQLIAADYTLFTTANVMAETAERLTQTDDESSAVQYRLFHGALAALSRNQHNPSRVLDSYLLRALAAEGWAPNFSECVKCGRPGPHASVNIVLGGSVCVDCKPSGSLSPGPSAVMLLAALLAGDWDLIDAADMADQRAASGIVTGYVQWHLERALTSMRHIERTT